MERSRSKRSYYYDQDYDLETLNSRSKPRYSNHYYSSAASHHRRGSGGSRNSKLVDSSSMATTSFRILCHDMKAGGVIGKSGSIIKAIRQRTGAWINVHELVSGDEERIIEISDARRTDSEGRMPSFSPAQEALFLVHERILESDSHEDDEYGGVRGNSRVVTRLVVSRVHVGCLLGKGGKIIEQMRVETKTQIRILPRDHTLPRCVSPSEEIVQVMGDANAVKNAIAIISSRLRESQHRDRSQFQGRPDSPERFFSSEDDFLPQVNNAPRRTSLEAPTFGSRVISRRSDNYTSHASGFPLDSPMVDAQPFDGDDLVFRILCPTSKVDRVVGESDGIIDLLRHEIGVDVKLSDPVVGSDEQIIIISSEEGFDDELFPAQEALLHIQTHIIDFVPEKHSVITTRLLVPYSDIGFMDGSAFEIRRSTGADVQILPREQLPAFISGNDELIQIVGELKASREALVEVTSRLRSHLHKEFFQNDLPPPPPLPTNLAGALKLESPSPNNINFSREGYCGKDLPAVTYQSMPAVTTAPSLKDLTVSVSEPAKPFESKCREDVPSILSSSARISVPLVTRSILEVVIPHYAVPKLITKSKSKLAQISELSGASVTLVDDRPDVKENVIKISGTPEQAERAQSLLQGFILSTLEDGP